MKIDAQKVAELVQKYNDTKDIGEASVIAAEIANLSPYKLSSLIALQQATIDKMRGALQDIAYAKTWNVLNKPMDLVSIALQALNQNASTKE